MAWTRFVGVCSSTPRNRERPGAELPRSTRPGRGRCPRKTACNWSIGQVAGIAVEREERACLDHPPPGDAARGRRNAKRVRSPGDATAAASRMPPVAEFDAGGQTTCAGWARPIPRCNGRRASTGIYVDPEGRTSGSAGNGRPRTTRSSSSRPRRKFLDADRPTPEKSEGSNSTTQLGRPAHMVMDPKAQSSTSPTATAPPAVIVFDAKSGAYKRHCGRVRRPAER